MTASELFLTHAQPWLQAEGRNRVRTMLPLPILVIAWWFASLPLSIEAWAVLSGYALFNLVLLYLLRQPHLSHQHGLHQLFHISSILSDVLLAILLLMTLGPLNGVIFPLYAVLAIKSLLYRRYFLWMLVVPTLLGPVYLSTLYLSGTQWIETSDQITYFGLIAGSCGFVLLMIILGQHHLHENMQLRQHMERQRGAYEARVAEMESINNDLRVRIRAQQALEESLRAVTSSLNLDGVFSQILGNTMQMLGTARVSAAALSLVDGPAFRHHTLMFDLTLAEDWAESLAQQVVAQRDILMVNDTLREHAWNALSQRGIASALSVPLIDTSGAVRGALSVLSTQRQAFTASEERHLNSFGIQACVAISNAELHSQLAHQEAMLEAVLRDIGDGLAVIDQRGEFVMRNPVAYHALMDPETGESLLDQLTHLARDVQNESNGMLRRELRIGSENADNECIYQAFASLVRISEDNQTNVAIVLHDITDQKAEERARTEFISMVSHELRNPINTLNGFLKLVVQGRAGPLSELQQEFLDLADSQVEQLKRRIKELLEFNRLNAGRLRLQPNWCDMADLIEATCTRLQLQADEAGLHMTCLILPEMPQVLADAERIGQVITNLVENAIKATSTGGTIAIGADVCDTELRVYVRDTGVGIPLGEQQKIFDRFYRAHRSTLNNGVHLGLGLSICQQIVEGHNGRMWVESEVGKGSQFTFTLPLVERKETVEVLQTV